MKQSPADILREMAGTFEERNALYGDSYFVFGDVMAALYPAGFRADCKSEYVRLGIVVQIMNKLIRYTSVPGGHKDSAHDLAVYAAMLESVTESK
jgi:hypothetical protein